MPNLLTLTGILGVIVILGIYLLLQIGKIRQDHPAYSLLNALGAAMIMVSLTKDFNLPAFMIEAAWFLISLGGFARSLYLRRPRHT
ncbi:MAG TPA: hypothetical protein PK014_08625 [Thermoanaerobaculia bacterium]|nr:hypothetical protein [Thermoanaerobaculia bacterium]HUM30260.1 hypothetical protein [Thermoanaerobaculia bacterium]HXK68444.1 hypothetical protein [Thermoanaerobaculia bacterium]